MYMVSILFCQYFENLDTSGVSMKRFNELPTGKYPSFTFCMHAEEGKIFNDEILQNKFKLGQLDYYQLLAGNENWTNIKMAKIPFSEVITGIDDFLEEFEVEDYSHQEYNKWATGMTKMSPFRQSYQDPTANCFTYDTKYGSSVSVSELSVRFNITTLSHSLDSGKVYIVAHYPGLLIRNLNNYLMKVKDWKELKQQNKANYITISISGVTLMRFRETANDACDPKLIDDDAKWKKIVVNLIGCSPPYWYNNSKDHDGMKQTCNSRKELGDIKAFWPLHGNILDTNKVFDQYTKPCNNFQQLIFNAVMGHDYSGSDLLKIKIRLQNNFYQEIRNIRAFGMTDLWASIGGYVGIFCGYSMLQTTSQLIANLKQCMDFIHNLKNMI